MNAIYVRQSIDKKDSLSIEGQIEHCRRYAGSDAEVFQDKGFSGKNTNRPAFTRLIEAVEQGCIQTIYVYRLDRFSRSIVDFGRLWELLEKHGVQFNSVTENFDTSSPMGRAMLNIVLVFAQLERETTAMRVKDNYIHRFSLGAWPGGPAPFGFDLRRQSEDGHKISTLVANEKREIVERIFSQYADDPSISLRSIAKSLMANGIHGPKREAWDNVTISRILHSPLYVRADEDIYWYYLTKGLNIQQGVEAFDGVHACNVIGRRDRTKNKYNSLDGQMLTVANHEGFIDSKLWLKVQEKLSRNPQISRANAGKYTWLTGLMKCEKCSYAIKINHVKSENRNYLICSGRSNLSQCDASISVNLIELEELVAREIQLVLDSSPPEDILPENASAAVLLDIDNKIERLVAALMESGDISAKYISAKIEALHKQREQMLSQNAMVRPTVKPLNFDELTFDEKKIVAAEFIDRILVGINSANIIWKL